MRKIIAVLTACTILRGAAFSGGAVIHAGKPMLTANATANEVFTEGDYEYTVTDGEATVTRFKDREFQIDVVILDTLGGYPVTAIGAFAFGSVDFQDNSHLKSVVIPEGVTNIGNAAF